MRLFAGIASLSLSFILPGSRCLLESDNGSISTCCLENTAFTQREIVLPGL